MLVNVASVQSLAATSVAYPLRSPSSARTGCSPKPATQAATPSPSSTYSDLATTPQCAAAPKWTSSTPHPLPTPPTDLDADTNVRPNLWGSKIRLRC
jgi:hypothetical protein